MNNEALRLADALDNGFTLYASDIDNAAAELRRQHALIADLVEALQRMVGRDMTFFDGYVDRYLITYGDVAAARAAIARAGEQQ